MAKELQGAAELIRQLRALGEAVEKKALRAATKAAIRPAMTKAKSMVPVGTVIHKTYKGRVVTPGFAARQLKIKSVRTRNSGIGIALLGVSKEAYYALQFVELGTSKQPPQPWLSRAFEATQDQQLTALSDALKRALLRAAMTK